MKSWLKILIIAVLVIGIVLTVVFSLKGQTAYYGQVHTIAWDPPDSGEYTYQIWQRHNTIITQGVVVDGLEYIVILPNEGTFAMGVATLKVIDSIPVSSTITWSDVEGVPEPWTLVYILQPEPITNFRVLGE